MIGRQIKSGARVKAERAVMEGTNNQGFLSKDRVNHVLNKEVLRSTLIRLGYSPKYNSYSVHQGWICRQ